MGIAFCVPTHNVYIVDLTWRLENAVKDEDIKKVLKQASKGPLKNILGDTKDQVISCDFNSDAYSSTFEAETGIVLSYNFVKLISWYDNEFCNSKEWWTSWPTRPPRSKKPAMYHTSQQGRRARERPWLLR